MEGLNPGVNCCAKSAEIPKPVFFSEDNNRRYREMRDIILMISMSFVVVIVILIIQPHVL